MHAYDQQGVAGGGAHVPDTVFVSCRRRASRQRCGRRRKRKKRKPATSMLSSMRYGDT